MNKSIPIFFATDDKYAPFLSVALESIIASSNEQDTYHIHVLYATLTKENIHSLSKYNKGNFVIFFNNVSEQLERVSKKLQTRDYYSKTTYYRMFIPELFPQYDKALYFDCDIALNRNVRELFDIELGDNLLGAVADEVVQITPVFVDYVQNFLGVEAKNYFNAGILLLNLRAMRQDKFEARFIDILNRVTFIVAQDQDYLNVLCSGRVLPLPFFWNKMPVPRDGVTLEDVALVHFNLAFKPWHYDNILFEQLFWSHAAKSEFYQSIVDIKNNYTLEEKDGDRFMGEKLQKMAGYFAYCGKNYKSYDFSTTSTEQVQFMQMLSRIV